LACDDCEAGRDCMGLDGWSPQSGMELCELRCTGEHLMAGGRSSISPEIDSS